MSYDYDPNMPTLSDLALEKHDTEVKAACCDHLREEDPWFARAEITMSRYAGGRRSRKQDYGSLVERLVDRIEHRMEDMIDDLYDEMSDAISDEAAYNADPYAYYGVSRRDFI